jgi:hypothetical protein
LTDKANGLRVFDWAQDYKPNGRSNIKRGHWLEQTPEMRDARACRHTCGYCGFQTDTPAADGFCTECWGSEYLQLTELKLLRMLPCAQHLPDRAALTAQELTALTPRYTHAQLHGTTERDKARIARARARLTSDRDSAIKHAQAQFDGLTWLMDQGYKTDNVIYYHHTGKFAFGWRQPLSGDVLLATKALLVSFPFPHEIVETK